jgi:acyl dehydratase
MTPPGPYGGNQHAFEPWEFAVEASRLAAFAKAVKAEPSHDQSGGAAVAPLTFPVIASATRLATFLTSVLGLDRARILHGGQSYRYHRRLTAGDRLRCSLSILEDIMKVGPRSGPMRIVVRQTAMHDAVAGTPVLIEQATTIELQEARQGASRIKTASSVHYDKQRCFGAISRADIARYAEAADDMNPLHVDDAAARRAGYPSVIAHGMLGAGLLGAFADELSEHESIVQFSVRFVELVFPEDILTAVRIGERADLSDPGRLRHTDLALINQNGLPVVTGSVVTQPATHGEGQRLREGTQPAHKTGFGPFVGHKDRRHS